MFGESLENNHSEQSPTETSHNYRITVNALWDLYAVQDLIGFTVSLGKPVSFYVFLAYHAAELQFEHHFPSDTSC